MTSASGPDSPGRPPEDTLDRLTSEAADLLRQPLPARVVGAGVKVVGVERQGNDRRGLVATVRRSDRTYGVSLADVEAEAGSPLGKLVDRYRALLGMEAAEGPADAVLRPGEVREVAVLAVKDRAAACRLLEGGQAVTFRSSGIWRLVPGEIATVAVKKSWIHAGTTYLTGEVREARLDVARLGLTPLRLLPQGEWDPDEEYWGEEEGPPAWAEAIIARGPRPDFEMEQVIPGADPDDWETDPIIEASERHQAGDAAGARALLMKLLREDLRCLDAHAHLGNHLLEHRPEDALRHYEAGVRIGELSLGEGFDGVLPWGMIDNRPFLRCLHGQGLALWALGRSAEARAVFERMLWLNPSDNQGMRLLVAALDRGIGYEAFGEEEQERANPYEPWRPPGGVSQLPIDMGELCTALEDHSDTHAWCLDRETGQILFVPENGEDDDLLPVPREELEESARFLAIEPEESHVGWRDMEEFIGTVGSGGLRDRLADAIAGKGAFGRFKRVLAEVPEERERWFAFRAERLEERARRWLESKGIEPVAGKRAR